MTVSDRPACPSLDKMGEVHDVSEQIGSFVMEYLAEQGIVLARWMWEQRPCYKSWGQKDDGSYVEISPLTSRALGLRYERVDVDPFECPCPVGSQEPDKPAHTYAHARWSLVQFHRSESWINDELARFFGLDPDEIERERSGLLKWLQTR